MSNLALQIQQEVSSAVDNDELELPSLPEVALRIREEAENKNVSAQSLAGVIGADPGLAARMIRVANSPLFRATRTIEDLNMALSRLGVEYAANLATGFAMQQMFQATSDIIDRKMRSVWSRATEVAAICGVLAKSYTRLRPDQATLAGLTHMIHIWSAQSTTVRDGPWRKPGLLEVSLSYDNLTVEMITDNKHLPTTLMKLAYKCIGPDRLCIISDATSGAGMPIASAPPSTPRPGVSTVTLIGSSMQ